MVASRIYLSPPDVSETERQYLLDAFDSNWISPLGPHVDAFEREFGGLVQASGAVALSSGTAALHLAMKALGVGPGHTVLVPTLTFAATANPVTYLGASPVFLDVSAETWTLDPVLLEEELTERKKKGALPAAVLTVDLYGQCCDYDPILAICRRFHVPLIADAAEAVGASYGSKPAGSFGACAAFSFNSNKIMTTGGGGMLVSHDRALIERVRYLATQARDPVPHYQHAEIGFNYRMSNLLAAIGRGQLVTLGQKLQRRRQINEQYRIALESREGISFMPEASYGKSNLWLTCIVIDPTVAGVSREDVRKHLEAQGIESRPVWKPMHLQPAFAHCDRRGGDVAADLFERGLCLPSGSSLTDQQLTRVIEAVTEVLDKRWFAAGAAPASTSAPLTPKPLSLPKAATVKQPSGLVAAKRLVLRSHRLLSVSSQVAVMALSNYAAILLRFDGHPPLWAAEAFWLTLPVLIAIRALSFLPLGLYQGLWRYTSLYDLQRLIIGIASSSALFTLYVLSPLGPSNGYPRSTLLIDPLLLTLGLSALRMSRRLYEDLSRKNTADVRRVLIYGAGSAGEMVAREMKAERGLGYQPVGFIDDDPSIKGRRIHGVPVLGTRAELMAIVERHRPTEVLVAIPSADPGTINSIVRAMASLSIPVKTLPHLKNIISGRDVTSQVRSLAVEDLIIRVPSSLDAAPLRRFVEGQSVLVTGAGGSVGSELCRQLLRLKPARLTLLDRHAATLTDVYLQLKDRRAPVELESVLADVTNPGALDAAFAQARPTIVLHAAGFAHGPLIEDNPCEAIRNNVTGTRLVVDAARRAGVRHVMLISSFKAANPSGVLGASKWLAEQVALASIGISATSVSVVRFGNVLGSAGSVVPRFVSQIQSGGPVTVSDPEAWRYFMLMPDAIQFVLHAAAAAVDRGVYAVDMGEPVRIVDIATNLIRLAGLTPGVDIHVEFTGLRPGERVGEDIAGEHETLKSSGVQRIWSVKAPAQSGDDVVHQIGAIEQLAAEGRSSEVRSALERLIGRTFS